MPGSSVFSLFNNTGVITGQPIRAVDVPERKAVLFLKRQIFISERTKTTRAFWGDFLVGSIVDKEAVAFL
jgi:hypothetical protein